METLHHRALTSSPYNKGERHAASRTITNEYLLTPIKENWLRMWKCFKEYVVWLCFLYETVTMKNDVNKLLNNDNVKVIMITLK